MNVFIDAFPRRNVHEGEVVVDRFGINFSSYSHSKKRFYFRSDIYHLFLDCIVEWFFAKPVSRDEKFFFPFIPKCKGEHTIQIVHTFLTVLGIGFQNNFGVGMCDKNMTLVLERLAYLFVAIYLAVKYDGIWVCIIPHRLMPTYQIDYGETSLPEDSFRGSHEIFFIWPTQRKTREHFFNALIFDH